MPTSTTAASTGASAKAAYAIPTTVSKNDSGWSCSSSTRWVYGATSLNARTNASSSIGSPSRLIRSVIDSRCGLVNRPDAQAERDDQRLDHPRGRGLAVGAGEVDRRVGALRVAEQLHERLDAVQGRVELGLGPAAQQRVLDLGVGLGEAACGGSGVSFIVAESRWPVDRRVARTGSRFRQDERALRRIRAMTDAPQHRPVRRDDRSTCGRRTGQGRARGARGEVVGAVEGRRHLRLRPHPDARGDLLDRHSPADRVGLAARRARLLLHPHRPRRALPADARQGGVLPDGLGRQRPADRAPGAELLRRALRPVAAVRRRLHARPRSPTRSDRSRSAGPTSSSSASSWSSQDEQVFEDLWRTLGLSVDWSQHYTTIGPKAQKVSQRAFLRNFARGEAYLQEAPTLWDVTFQTAVAQAELEAREYAGHYHRVHFHGADGPGPDRDHPTRADPLGGGADRPPRRRALPAAVRHHGHLAGLRRGDPGARPPRRRARQGRRHRDVLHLRRPHRRHLVARAAAAGAHADRSRRPDVARDPRVAGERTGRGGVRGAQGQDRVQRPRGDGRDAARERRPRGRADARPSGWRTSTRRATSRWRSSPPASGTSPTAAATPSCAPR